MSDRLVELGLNQPSHLAALPHFDRLLELLGELLVDPEDGSGRDVLLSRIADYRSALHAGGPARIRTAGEALLASVGDAVERAKKQRISMRSEIADLVRLFHEITASVAGEGAAISAEMGESAARFSALSRINDIRLLKDRLRREVDWLRDTARAREQRWEGVVTSFKDKVESLEEQLLATQQEATLDPLTGVANRRLFDRTLKDMVSNHGRRFALVMIDVDNFKGINDQLGHDTGDRVLQTIAHLFATSVRSEDMVARLGGDEFAILLENVTLTQAGNRVSHIAGTLSAEAAREGLGKVSISCGVAEYSAGDTPQSLVKRADDALYDAKRQGKGRVAQKAAPLIRDLQRR